MGSGCSKHRALEDCEENDDSSFPWLEKPGLKIGRATDVRRAYRLTRDVLGEGRTSVVWVGVERSSGVHVAVKMLSKRIVTTVKGEDHRTSEIEILLALQQEDIGTHPNENTTTATTSSSTSSTIARTNSSSSRNDSSRTANTNADPACSSGISASRPQASSQQPNSSCTSSDSAHPTDSDTSHTPAEPSNPASMSTCSGVLPVLGTFEDDRFLFLVTPLMAGGDLLSHIASRPKFSERHASAIVKHLLKALAFLHAKGIAHLDINPTNILFPSPSSKHPHLVDFGSAMVIPPEGAASPSPTTTPFFAAPEVSQKRVFTQAADMWSLGALLFLMAGGVHPKLALGKVGVVGGCGESTPEVDGNAVWLRLQAGDVEGLPDEPSQELQNFLGRLLTPNRSERMTASEALLHPWISAPPCRVQNRFLQSSVRNCKEYVSRRAAGRIGGGVVSCSTPKVYQQDARRRAGTVSTPGISRANSLNGPGIGEARPRPIEVVDDGLDLEPLTRRRELKWKSVESIVTDDIKEFVQCEGKTKVFIEVLGHDTPQRKSRHRSKDYIEVSGVSS